MAHTILSTEGSKDRVTLMSRHQEIAIISLTVSKH